MLRPQDYDQDIDLALRTWLQIDSTTSVAAALVGQNRSAQELIEKIMESVGPFVAMLRGLLGLYEEIGARSATNDNLRIEFEFNEGEVSMLLREFREIVRRWETIESMTPTLQFSNDTAWKDLFPTFASRDDALRIFGSNDYVHVPDAVPDFPATGNEDADAALSSYRGVLVRYLAVLKSLAPNREALGTWIETLRGLPESDNFRTLAYSATDFWLFIQTTRGILFAEAVRDGTASADDAQLQSIQGWVDGFRMAQDPAVIRRAVDEFADILSLPVWGFRHELYSAWLVTQIEEAVGPMRFDTVEGALRFSFRPTRIAEVDSPSGVIELWCEVQSPITNPIGHGRVDNIQPDYRFIQTPTDAPATDKAVHTIGAIEAKQYLRSAKKNPGEALADYAKGLPNALVILAAYGPVSPGAQLLVHPDHRNRADAIAHVRPGSPSAQSNFRDAVTAIIHRNILAVAPFTLELRWSPQVDDLDLHITTSDSHLYFRIPRLPFGELREDAIDGGPEFIDIRDLTTDLELRVHLYSGASLDAAEPILIICGGDAVAAVLSRVPGGEGPWWNVATIRKNGEIVVSSQTRVEVGSPPSMRGNDR